MPTEHRTAPGTATATLLAGILALTAVGYRLVPGTVRVHWSLGGPYVGPEKLPALLGLGILPGTALVVVGLLAGLPKVGVVPSTVARSRPYRLAAPAVTATLALGQLLLVVANGGLL